jgi:hypothetical protein
MSTVMTLHSIYHLPLVVLSACLSADWGPPEIFLSAGKGKCLWRARNSDPGQNQKSHVVGQEFEICFPCSRIPADKVIPEAHFQAVEPKRRQAKGLCFRSKIRYFMFSPSRRANSTEGIALGKAGCDSSMDWLRSAGELIRYHPLLFSALEQSLFPPWFDTIIKMRRSSEEYHKLIDFFPILMKNSKNSKNAWQLGGGWYTIKQD